MGFLKMLKTRGLYDNSGLRMSIFVLLYSQRADKDTFRTVEEISNLLVFIFLAMIYPSVCLSTCQPCVGERTGS